MPLGDPMGGEFYDLGRGQLTRVWMAMVPVRDLNEAIEFYQDSFGLKLRLDARERNWVEMGAEEPLGKIALYVPGRNDPRQPGGETGVVFATESVFDLHRRLVDEGVNFISKPERQPWGGLMAVFEDLYGNRFTVLDDPAHYERAPVKETEERKERDSGVTIRTIITKP